MQHRVFYYSSQAYTFIYQYRTILLTLIILAVLTAALIAPGMVRADEAVGGSSGGG